MKDLFFFSQTTDSINSVIISYLKGDRILNIKYYLLFFILFIFLLSQYSCRDNSTTPEYGINTWEYLGLKGEMITAIGIDPTNENIIYAGSRYNFSYGTPGRLFKSTDGGKTWDTLITDYGSLFVKIIVDPNKPNIVYAAPWGIIKSLNGGKTWQEQDFGISTLTGEAHIASLVIDPNDSNILYAGTGGVFGGYLYKTTNSGTTWNRIGGDSLGDGIISIAIEQSNHNVIYAGTAGNGLLWRSTDAGINWKRTGIGETNEIIYCINIDINNEDNIFIGMSWISGTSVKGIYQSLDGGNDWDAYNQGLPNNSIVNSIAESLYGKYLYVAVSNINVGKTGLYKRSIISGIWEQIGIDSLSSVVVVNKSNTLFYGGNGIYKLPLNEIK